MSIRFIRFTTHNFQIHQHTHTHTYPNVTMQCENWILPELIVCVFVCGVVWCGVCEILILMWIKLSNFYLQWFKIVQAQKHFIVDFGDFIFWYEQILYFQCTFKCIRFDTGDLITTQVQFYQIWQAAKQSIRFYSTQFVIVEQSIKWMEEKERERLREK